MRSWTASDQFPNRRRHQTSSDRSVIGRRTIADDSPIDPRSFVDRSVPIISDHSPSERRVFHDRSPSDRRLTDRNQTGRRSPIVGNKSGVFANGSQFTSDHFRPRPTTSDRLRISDRSANDPLTSQHSPIVNIRQVVSYRQWRSQSSGDGDVGMEGPLGLVGPLPMNEN